MVQVKEITSLIQDGEDLTIDAGSGYVYRGEKEITDEENSVDLLKQFYSGLE